MIAADLRVFPHPEDAAEAAAQLVIETGRAAIESSGRFAWALAGGSTPRLAYQALAQRRDALDWTRVHVFFGDERAVPPDHPESNFGMAHKALLSQVPIPAEQIHRMRGESSDPLLAAAAYQAEWAAALGHPGEPPPLDLILLGMGADGHTASLFPGTSALGESARWVVATRVEQFGAWRITLTFPALRAGRRIVFLVTGRDKAAALARVLGAAPGGHDLPAARIAHSVNGVIWLIDQAAAAELG